MSLEQARLFIERMKTDEAFRDKIMAVEDVAQRMQLVKAEGYDFTEEEINNVSSELGGDAAVEGVSAAGEEGCACKGWICNCWLRDCHCKGYDDCRQTYRK